MSGSREGLSLWLCEAHNEVNLRNGKEAFFCDMGVLDARWKDCGCDHKANHSSSAAQTDVTNDIEASADAAVGYERRSARRRNRNP